MNIGVLASHRGTVLQAVLDACAARLLRARVAVVVSNNSASGALARAAATGVPYRHLSGKTHPDAVALDNAIAETLVAHDCDLLLLAGYMKRLGAVVRAQFRGRILNTHPSLLPRHGGLGMYGHRVHEAVLQSGDTVTGVTIHLVDSEYDTGPIVAQHEIPVHPDDTIETLAARVTSVETGFVVETIRRIATGALTLPGGLDFWREWDPPC